MAVELSDQARGTADACAGAVEIRQRGEGFGHGLLCLGRDEQSQGCERAEGHVFERGEVSFDQWEVGEQGFRFVDGFAVEDEDDSLAIASGVPLLDSAVEIELHGVAHFGWQDFHDLFLSDAGFDGQGGHYGGDFGGCGGLGRDGESRGGQEQEGAEVR